jgi:beta-phosphoglucomutase-like phosphatase (HAD superfamily)
MLLPDYQAGSGALMTLHHVIQMGMARGVLFDLDGVLLNSTGMHDAALREAVKLVTSIDVSGAKWGEEAERSSTKLRRVGITEPDVLERIREAKSAAFITSLANGPRRWPDASQLYQQLRGVQCVGLVTSMSWQYGALPRVLRLMGYDKLFDQIFAPFDGGTGKVELYRAASWWVGLVRALPIHSTLVLEDSDVGVEAAREAGFGFIQKVTFQTLGEML